MKNTDKAQHNARARRTAVGSLRGALAGVVLAAAGALTACGPAAELRIPAQLVEVPQHDGSPYDFKAATASGVVVAWRTVTMGEDAEIPHAELAFWVEATRLRMRSQAGYALVHEEEVQSADGTRGMRLEFGRDENGRPHTYWVTLFTTADRLHVLEAGGQQTEFDASREAVIDALASYRIRR